LLQTSVSVPQKSPSLARESAESPFRKVDQDLKSLTRLPYSSEANDDTLSEQESGEETDSLHLLFGQLMIAFPDKPLYYPEYYLCESSSTPSATDHESVCLPGALGARPACQEPCPSRPPEDKEDREFDD
jgi:hypothetical protein